MCLGKHWITSDSEQYVWLEDLLTVSHFEKSLMIVQQLLLGKTPTDKSVCENLDLA